jgi:hypothetical protein
MTRPDLFDAASIPGIQELARAGAVAPDPAALRAARARLDAAIAAQAAEVSPTSAAGAAAVSPPSAVDAVTVGRSGRRWLRRSLAVAAVAAIVPLGQIVWDTADPGGARVAMAADGSLQCSLEGYGAPIPPSQADLRLLPTALPQGWRLETVAARWETSNDPAACSVPALSLVRIDGGRAITGAVTVHGPFAAVDVDSFTGTRSTAQVAGQQGMLLDSPEGSFQRWVWTADGNSWVMEAQQLTRDEGTLLAAGVTTAGSEARWEPGADGLGLQVVAQRYGPPPTYRAARLSWYVDLSGPEGRSAHYTVDYQPDHPAPVLEASALGAVVSADGTQSRIERRTPAQEASVTVWRDGLRIDAGSGPVFGSGGPTPAADPAPFEVLAAIVDSLAPAPADDPRLTQYALVEDTVPHP